MYLVMLSRYGYKIMPFKALRLLSCVSYMEFLPEYDANNTGTKYDDAPRLFVHSHIRYNTTAMSGTTLYS